MPEKRSFTKEEVEKLKSHVPIKLVGEDDVDKKKAQLFDMFANHKAKYFLVWKQEAIMGSEKLELSLADGNEVFRGWKGLYAVLPVSGEVTLSLIMQVI